MTLGDYKSVDDHTLILLDTRNKINDLCGNEWTMEKDPTYVGGGSS